MATVKLPIEGSCQCGALRYEINAAPMGIYCCHCTNCQKITGSAFVLSAAVPEPAFAFTHGKPGKTEWRSDAGNSRYGHYCRDCGCRIAHGQTPSIGVLSVRAGTFDDTSWIAPAGHIWTRSAQPWIRFHEDDIIEERQPKDYMNRIERFQKMHTFTHA